MNHTPLVIRDKIKAVLDEIDDLRMICARLEATVSAANVQFLEKTNEISQQISQFNTVTEELIELKEMLNDEILCIKSLQEKEKNLELSIEKVEKQLAFFNRVRQHIRNDGLKITLAIILLTLTLIIHMIRD